MTLLRGERFTLEPMRVSHAKGLFPVLSQPNLYEFIEYPPPATEEDLAGRFKRWEDGGSPDGSEVWLNWAVRLSNLELVGHVQATVMHETTAWIAYMISEHHWGKGLGRLATSLMVEHLISQHRCKILLACIDRENRRSSALLRSLSFSLASPEEHVAHELSKNEELFVYT